MSISKSAPMSDDTSFHVLEAVPNRLEASPQRARRCWSAQAKARLIEATLKPGANCVGDRARGWSGDLAVIRLAAQGDQRAVRSRCSGMRIGLALSRSPTRRLQRWRSVWAMWSFGLAPMLARIIWQDYQLGPPGMIPASVKVFVGSHPVAFRKGPDHILALVRDAGSDPFLCSGRWIMWRSRPAPLGPNSACLRHIIFHASRMAQDSPLCHNAGEAECSSACVAVHWVAR